ncbi:MAG: guanylate kinase [Planctomycetota bacterium]|nr:MAG: guanylate kinase [Planctomycetota bacterium]
MSDSSSSVTSASSSTGRRTGTEKLRIVVLSGPSGTGKSTIVNRLTAQQAVKLIKAISATTRAPRNQERDGEDYYFLSKEEFLRRRDANEFVECFEVHGSGNWYGTLKSELQRAHDLGGWAMLEIDVQGAMHVVAQYPEAVTIFIRTASEAEFEQRLRARGTESEEVIQRRLETARRELEMADRYRYQVINDDLDRATDEIVQILKGVEGNSNA